MTDETRKGQGKKKKPYLKPKLDFATVYEASGATCCKTAGTCTTSTKGALGKTSNTSTTS